MPSPTLEELLKRISTASKEDLLGLAREVNSEESILDEEEFNAACHHITYRLIDLSNTLPLQPLPQPPEPPEPVDLETLDDDARVFCVELYGPNGPEAFQNSVHYLRSLPEDHRTRTKLWYSSLHDAILDILPQARQLVSRLEEEERRLREESDG